MLQYAQTRKATQRSHATNFGSESRGVRYQVSKEFKSDSRRYEQSSRAQAGMQVSQVGVYEKGKRCRVKHAKPGQQLLLAISMKLYLQNSFFLLTLFFLFP
jgi:hypothetical protein